MSSTMVTLSDSEQVSEVVVTDRELEPQWSHSDRVKTEPVVASSPHGRLRLFPASRFEETLRP